MTSLTQSSFSPWIYASPIGVCVLRATVGTPLDAVATRQVIHNTSILQIMKNMSPADYWKGFQPNTLKFITKTPVQFFAVKVSSSVIPTEYDAAIRGIYLGLLSNVFEITASNGWNSIRTRFIQGQGWKSIGKEGPPVLFKGLSSAFLHRSASGALFWSVYEKLKEQNPSHPMLVSTFSGTVQVVLTSPFYITAIYRQRKEAPQEYLYQTMMHLFKTRGLPGLFLSALGPRLVHSAITTYPLMWVMEKLQLIHRKH